MAHIDRAVSHGHLTVGTRDWGGSGPPVILLPGGGRNLTDWELVVPQLVGRHRVVGVDLPGHGASSEPDRWSWDDAVGFVESAADALHLDNPFVIGHSLGGMVAARYGARHPESPGVVNVDGHGLGGPSTPDAFHAARARLMAESPPPPSDEGDDAWLQDQLAAVRPSVDALGIDWQAARPALMRSFRRTSTGWRRAPSTSFVQTLPDIGPDLFDVYRSVRCRLAIFDCTRKVGPPFSDDVAAAYGAAIARDLAELEQQQDNVEIVTIDAGHMVLLEQPRDTARILLSFMDC